MYSVQGNEELYIIEVKTYSSDSNFHVYSLYIGNERPIYHNNKMVFFFDIACAERALMCSNCGATAIRSIPKEKNYTFDFYEVLRILENVDEKFVCSSELLNCLNLMEDYCFDTMDFWTDEHKKQNLSVQEMVKQPDNDEEPKYMVPISPQESIKDEYDFLQKIFAAARHFFTDTDIDRHFQEAGYDRIELLKAMKYLIGEVATSAVFVT